MKKKDKNIILLNETWEIILKINGNKRISSTSKIKNTREIKKNRMEKGIRALNLGVNPHSKGLIFSRLKIIFFLNISPSAIIIKEKIKKISKVIKKINISLRNFIIKFAILYNNLYY